MLNFGQVIYLLQVCFSSIRMDNKDFYFLLGLGKLQKLDIAVSTLTVGKDREARRSQFFKNPLESWGHKEI